MEMSYASSALLTCALWILRLNVVVVVGTAIRNARDLPTPSANELTKVFDVGFQPSSIGG